MNDDRRQFHKVSLVVDPFAGSVVSTVTRQACILALVEEREVHLKFNTSTIIIEPDKVVRELLKQYPMGSDEGK